MRKGGGGVIKKFYIKKGKRQGLICSKNIKKFNKFFFTKSD